MVFLNIAILNVHGLSDYKLDDDHFSNLSSMYEVVCFVETML